MSLLCSQCAHENPDQSTFCIRCGNRLQSNSQSAGTGPVGSSSLPPYMPGPTTSSAPTFVTPPNMPGPATSLAPTYMTPPNRTPPPPPPVYGQSSGSSYLPNAPAAASAAPSSQYPVQMGSGQGQVSIRRAFAGYGTLVLHHSWLVNGGAEQAVTARDTIFNILRQRSIPGLNVNQQKLMERGVLMEERDYLVARRGVSTIFIYTAPAGNDLYISRATTVLPAISTVRVIILCAAILVMIIGLVAHPASSGSPFDIIGTLIGGLFAFLSGLIFVILILLLIRSLISWIIEKDFWVILRPNSLNDFQLDDIKLMEHVTDDTAKTAVKQVGLDASQITPPPMGYEGKRRIRTI